MILRITLFSCQRIPLDNPKREEIIVIIRNHKIETLLKEIGSHGNCKNVVLVEIFNKRFTHSSIIQVRKRI